MTEDVTEMPRSCSIAIQSDVACGHASFHGTRYLNGRPQQQKLLCDGGFTRVRVRNDGECAARVDGAVFSDMSPPMTPRIMPVNEGGRLLKREF